MITRTISAAIVALLLLAGCGPADETPQCAPPAVGQLRSCQNAPA